jgi:hypothetical protein
VCVHLPSTKSHRETLRSSPPALRTPTLSLTPTICPTIRIKLYHTGHSWSTVSIPSLHLCCFSLTIFRSLQLRRRYSSNSSTWQPSGHDSAFHPGPRPVFFRRKLGSCAQNGFTNKLHDASSNHAGERASCNSHFQGRQTYARHEPSS